MESLFIFWRVLSLLSMFLFPQLIGVLLHFRLVRSSRVLAFALGLLVPAVLFFYLAPLVWFAGLREAYRSGDGGCGMPAVAAGVMILAGTVAELILSLPIQRYLLRRNRRLVQMPAGSRSINNPL